MWKDVQNNFICNIIYYSDKVEIIYISIKKTLATLWYIHKTVLPNHLEEWDFFVFMWENI